MQDGSEVVYHAGFPNPAETSDVMGLSLDTLIVQHQASTYFWRLTPEAAESVGVTAGTIAVVDRALLPRNNDTVVAIIDESFVIRQFHRDRQTEFLSLPSGEKETAEQTSVWGVVTYLVQPMRKQR
ncbi:MAG TPA: S24 family peptidase [Verrucomicrobiae bacterium]|nr:S24 family peptidase [Verrucomicrobiae bacterium]